MKKGDSQMMIFKVRSICLGSFGTEGKRYTRWCGSLITLLFFFIIPSPQNKVSISKGVWELLICFLLLWVHNSVLTHSSKLF